MWLVIGYWFVVDVVVWEGGDLNPWAAVCPQIPASPHPSCALVFGVFSSSWPSGLL